MFIALSIASREN